MNTNQVFGGLVLGYGEFGRGVTAVGVGNKVFVYFLCNDSSNRLLGTTLIV
jgi:hypothetical protein